MEEWKTGRSEMPKRGKWKLPSSSIKKPGQHRPPALFGAQEHGWWQPRWEAVSTIRNASTPLSFQSLLEIVEFDAEKQGVKHGYHA